VIRGLTAREAEELLYSWRVWARPEQLAPVGAWDVWLILAGRGFGKTRSGAEWVCERANLGALHIYLIGATASDVRDVMVEGESGIMACSPPWNMPHYEPSKRRVTWPNGCRASTFSADEPNRLRGPQADTAWADELAAWRYPDAWDQLSLGLRSVKSGLLPQAVVTTTPRPTPIIKSLIADPTTVVTRGSTYDNKANLAGAFLRKIERKYEGTRLGRQELYAEVLDDNPGALWKRKNIDDLRVVKAPEMRRVVVAIDPAVSSNADSAETGIIVAGLGVDGHGYVLADYSLSDTPAKWGHAVITAYNAHRANTIIAETNNGGDLVGANVLMAAGNAGQLVHFQKVHASRGKQVRAEPVAAIYEQGRIHHVGAFAQLEDQLCDWDPAGGGDSPDRLDALVWAFFHLMVEPREVSRRINFTNFPHG